MSDNVADLGEFGLIAAIAARMPQTRHVVVGPGDDAAVVNAPDRRVVASTDLLVEGNHFRRDWSSGYDVGRRAAASNLADVVAMGAKPTALLVGLGCPADLPTEWALRMADGFREEGEILGVSVAGGDVVRSSSVIVSVTALGDLDGRPPVLRAGARPGDVVAIAGRLGWAAAGLAVLSRGFRSPRVLVEAQRRPEVPYEAGLAAPGAGATAMCDVSDGLLADLGHIAEASGVAVDVDTSALAVPDEMRDPARALGADPMVWILTGGEDHALVATFPSDAVLPSGWRAIGTVGDGSGVTVDGAAYDRDAGHDHFRVP
ncbi:MAG TPA: thiamine-phosphate kinase [Jiangellaceae bacterium]